MRIGYLGMLDRPKNNTKPLTASQSTKKSFSLSYDPDDLRLFSSAKVTIGDKTFFTDKAMWDTGSTITAISHATAQQYHAIPNETGTSISATDRLDADIYQATIELPGGIVFRDIDLWDISLSHLDVEIVIGMDIISQGKLLVETVNGTPMFSFSIE